MNLLQFFNANFLSKKSLYETSMLKALLPKGMINSEQHVSLKKQ